MYVLLFLLPKNFISCLMGHLVSIRFPRFFAIAINRSFARLFSINLDEAVKPIEEYPSLQEFFIRRLKENVRPISAKENALVSPCDGMMGVSGVIDDGILLQAKGKYYSIRNLLVDEELAACFINGFYATLYLSPRDYHRFHMPIDGKIIKTIYIPGTLWPVNHWGVHTVKELFCQNERVISIVEHEKTGRLLAHIAVGATMVGKMHLNYCDIKKPCFRRQKPRVILHAPVEIKKGCELGQFMFGSTIIVLCEQGLIDGFVKEAPTYVKMGETLGIFAKDQK